VNQPALGEIFFVLLQADRPGYQGGFKGFRLGLGMLGGRGLL